MLRLAPIAFVPLCYLLAIQALVAQAPPVVTFAEEAMRLRTAAVVAGTTADWNVTLTMEDDNADASLGASFRRWWHCRFDNVTPGDSLRITVGNAGYTDIILPVWSLSADGVTFAPYERLPTSAVPALIGGTQHRFTVTVPPGVVAFRLAKYFPYTVTRKNAWLASLAGAPQLRSVTVLGNSLQGRPIERLTMTDANVPDAGKTRVWLHAGIHPAETTAYFTMEGLVEWLCSDDPEAAVLLDHALIELVPMANPDGVFLGNYRTTANSVNLENGWSAPYTNAQPEIVALRTAIEACMGTIAAPGSNPIRVLLNLHSSHGVEFPFHFQHVANPAWHPITSNTGVIPLVHALEGQWITQFAARSPFVALGQTQSSALVSRPFVESMCHDRWTAQPGWLNAPGLQAPAMAMTFEGSYRRGPDGVTWNTEADYRLCGAQLGQALFDHLGLHLTASATTIAAPCVTTTLQVALSPLPNGAHAANLQVAGGAANGLGLLVLGGAPLAVPLPPPWDACTLLASPDVQAPFLLGGNGGAVMSFVVPPLPGLTAWLQALSFDLSQPPAIDLDASNGIRLQNDY